MTQIYFSETLTIIAVAAMVIGCIDYIAGIIAAKKEHVKAEDISKMKKLVVAGIGVAFFEIVGWLVLRSEVYAEFGTLAVIAMLAGLFLWAVSMVAMGYDDDIETEKTEKEEKQKQEVAE